MTEEAGTAHLDAGAGGLEALFIANPLPMWIYDLDSLQFLAVNNAAVASYGWSRDELLSMTILDIRPAVEVTSVRAAARRERSGWEGPRRWLHQRADGSSFDVEITAHTIVFGGRPAELVLAQDVSEQTRAARALAEAALHDPLTGLANRTLLDDELGEAVRPGAPGVATFMIDLDRFKDLNDTLGHAAGDELLRVVGQRLLDEVRPVDTVARFGGDEFVVCCPGLTDSAAAMALAWRIRERLAVPVDVRGRSFTPGATIGVAVAQAGSTATAEELVRDADAAMYEAKAAGGGAVRLFDDDLRDRNLFRLELEHDLRLALDEGGLTIALQPICDLETRTMRGAEALLRWSHPTRGEMAPIEVIEVAERTGLIHVIGVWVLAEACRHAADWLRRWPDGPLLGVAVNVSSVQLAADGFVDTVAGVLASTGLPGASLSLEITETAAMGDVDVVAQRLSALRALGVHVVIDDFGTGYSSLVHLKRFPVSALKIDRSFVDGLDVEPEDTAIVGATLSLASALGLHCVAEGIETEAQLAALLRLGCGFGQGYLLARPLSPEALTDLLEAADGTVVLARLGEG